MIEWIKRQFTNESRLNNFIAEMRSMDWQSAIQALNPMAKTSREEVSDDENLKLSAVWASLNVLANALAVLPLGMYKIDDMKSETTSRYMAHPLDWLISTRPSKLFSRYQWIYNSVHDMYRKGHSLTIIHRDKTHLITELEFIPYDEVVVMVNETNTDVRFMVPHRYGERQFLYDEVLFFAHYTKDGCHTDSVLDYAVNATYLARSSDQTAGDFYASGASVTGYLSTQGNIGQRRADDIKERWREQNGKSSGSQASIPVLEAGLEFHPITVKPNDAQLLETRQFNAIEIARFFNVPPSKIFASENNYDSYEIEQMAFLQQTLTPLIEKFSQEMNYKLLKLKERGKRVVQFDETAVLRGDLKSQADYFYKMAQIGVFSPNMIKGKLKEPSIENGDKHFVGSNMVPLDKVDEVFKKNQDNKLNGEGNTNGKGDSNGVQSDTGGRPEGK